VVDKTVNVLAAAVVDRFAREHRARSRLPETRRHPSDDPAGKHVNDKRDVDEAAPGFHAHLPPDLPRPAHLAVLVPDATDDCAQHFVALRPCRAPRRIPLPGFVPEGRGRGQRNTRQIGSTPNCSRRSSMNPTITSLGGRAPPGRNMQRLSSGSRSRSKCCMSERCTISGTSGRWRSWWARKYLVGAGPLGKEHRLKP
jgi:hypothetical protein